MSSASLSRAVAASLAVSAALGLPSPARAGFLYGRLSPAGTEPNGASTSVHVSSNGRTVVFSSGATNWAPLGSDYNGNRIVAVDLDTGVVEVVSVPPSGPVFRGEAPAVSGDGRYVAFLTYSTSYGPNWQVVRKDRQTGGLEVASATAAGQPADAGTNDDTVSISADGRYVAFETASGNFGVPTSGYETFVKDMQTGQVRMVSVKSDGSPSGGGCEIEPHALSDDGRFLTMICSASMVPGARTGQVYVRDLQSNTTELISRSATAASGSTAFAYRPAISPSGRFVSFQNRGYGGLGYANGVDSAGNSGVYLRDRQSGATIPLPRPATVPAAEYDSCAVSSVSSIGSVLLACYYTADSAVGRVPQVFLSIPGEGAPMLLSTNAADQPGNGQSGYTLAVNASGLSMAWESAASNIDPDDHNGKTDIFVLVDESVISDTIFAYGFETVPASRQQPAGRFQTVPVVPGTYGSGAARD